MSNRAPDQTSSKTNTQSKVPKFQVPKQNAYVASQVPKHSMKSIWHVVVAVPHLKSLSLSNQALDQTSFKIYAQTKLPNSQIKGIRGTSQSSQRRASQIPMGAETPEKSKPLSTSLISKFSVERIHISNESQDVSAKVRMFQRKSGRLSHHYASLCRLKVSNSERSYWTKVKAKSITSETSPLRQSSMGHLNLQSRA